MISKSNFDLAKPYLQYQLNERGESTPLSIDKWDTFDEGNKGKLSLTGFSLRYKVLFSADQTY